MTQHVKFDDGGTSLVDSFMAVTGSWFESAKMAYEQHKEIRRIEQELSTYSDRDLLSIGMSRAQIREAVKAKYAGQ